MKESRILRVEALDVFRSITMFLMLFVNDIPGLKEIPHWMFHAEATEDMLGFSDTIFPGFLFAMGMAVPFAIQNRLAKGDSKRQVVVHILLRSLALVVMGLFTVNLEKYDGSLGLLSHSWFSILMAVAFFLVWSYYPKTTGRRHSLYVAMQIAGLLVLLFLFAIYKGEEGASFAPYWWGILGLIGWTYLAAAILFLFTKENLWLNGLVVLLMLLCSFGSSAGLYKEIPLLQAFPSWATLYLFGTTGVFASLLMQKLADREQPARFMLLMCGIGVVMLVAGRMVHPYWIISKIQATSTWYFFCCALFFPLFALIYWLCDVKNQGRWFRLIRPAGTVTLTCYVIPYFWYAVCNLLGLEYPDFLCAGIPGLLRSVVYSLFIIGIAALLKRAGIRLKI